MRPCISARSEAPHQEIEAIERAWGPLQPGMVINIEPSRYTLDALSVGGVEIEDSLLITDAGSRLLTTFAYDERLQNPPHGPDRGRRLAANPRCGLRRGHAAELVGGIAHVFRPLNRTEDFGAPVVLGAVRRQIKAAEPVRPRTAEAPEARTGASPPGRA